MIATSAASNKRDPKDMSTGASRLSVLLTLRRRFHYVAGVDGKKTRLLVRASPNRLLNNA